MATRTILFRGQTRRKGERTSISGIPLPGIWVAGGVFPQNKGYDYAIIYQQNPKVEKYVVHADTIGQYTGINDSLGNFIFEDDIITFWLKNDATRTRRKGVVEYSESSARFMVRVCESTDVVMLKDCCCIHVIGNVFDGEFDKSESKMKQLYSRLYVFCSGHEETFSNGSSFPVCDSHYVMVVKEGKKYKVPYPFDCNRFADKLNKKSNEKERLTPAQRLFFWTEYKNPIE